MVLGKRWTYTSDRDNNLHTLSPHIKFTSLTLLTLISRIFTPTRISSRNISYCNHELYRRITWYNKCHFSVADTVIFPKHWAQTLLGPVRETLSLPGGSEPSENGFLGIIPSFAQIFSLNSTLRSPSPTSENLTNGSDQMQNPRCGSR